jgi:DNA-binding LytR/AlgR family response regulator
MYSKSLVYELKQKLYEIESRYGESDFFRASKSVIVNLSKIKYISPAYGGRFEACLDNGEKVVISRQYVPELRKKLKI